MKATLVIDVTAQGVRLSAGVNGVPLAGDASGDGLATVQPLNLWLRPDANALDVQVAPAGDRDRLVDVSVRAPGPEAVPMTRLSWTLPPAAAFEPFRVSLPFAPPRVPPVRVWSEAARFDRLDDGARSAAIGLGREVHEAFAARDVDRMTALLDYRITEWAAAFGWDEAQHRARVREELAAFVEPSPLALEPLEGVDARLVAGGQLVWLTRGGRPLLERRAQPEAGWRALDVYVACVGDRWRVAR